MTRSLFDLLDGSNSARGERSRRLLREHGVTAIAVHLDPAFSDSRGGATLSKLPQDYPLHTPTVDFDGDERRSFALVVLDAARGHHVYPQSGAATATLFPISPLAAAVEEGDGLANVEGPPVSPDYVVTSCSLDVRGRLLGRRRSAALYGVEQPLRVVVVPSRACRKT